MSSSSYELIYIISPEVTDEQVPDVLNKASESINRVGGNVTEVVEWGRKKMAYPIRKFADGNYVFTRLEMEPASAKDLEANLRLSDEILRHLLIKLKD